MRKEYGETAPEPRADEEVFCEDGYETVYASDEDFIPSKYRKEYRRQKRKQKQVLQRFWENTSNLVP